MLIFQIDKTAHGTGSLLSEYALKNELTMGNCCDSRKKKTGALFCKFDQFSFGIPK